MGLPYKAYYENSLCLSFIEEEPQHVRSGCARLQFNIPAWVNFHPAGEYEEGDEGWTVSDFLPEEQGKFKSELVRKVRAGLGDGAIWIYHTKSGLRDLWCDVKVGFDGVARGQAKLVINAIKNPVPIGKSEGFRDSCRIGGQGQILEWDNPYDMTIALGSVVTPAPPNHLQKRKKWASDTEAWHTFEQDTLLHEFGHYIGLDHACAGDGASNAKEEYCHEKSWWQQNDLMAVGNEIRRNHSLPFLNRLSKHDYADGYLKLGFAPWDRTKRPWLDDPRFDDGLTWSERAEQKEERPHIDGD